MTSRRQGLVALLPRLRSHVERIPPGAPLREASATVAVKAYGESVVRDNPLIAVHLAALAILSRCQPATYLARPAASALVHATDLHFIPDAPPRLLRAPGIVETRRPETGEVLWDDYVSLGWYQIEGVTYVLGLRYPDGFEVARWTPRWTGKDLEPELPEIDRSALVDDVDAHQEFARDAARYVIVLGLLAEAANSPLRIELDKRERTTRHVYLGDHASAPRTVAAGTEAGVAEAVPVAGHLRRQRYGPGHAKTQTIYVCWRSHRTAENWTGASR
jgi:hypothetical protein